MSCAMQRLALRQEPRKMMFVITDGNPEDQPLVEKMMFDAQVLGVLTLAFDIGTRFVKGFDSPEVFVDDASTLYLAVKDAIKANLLTVG